MTEALAGVHSNESVERRHRTLTEIMNAQMARGGAGPKLWEFTTPTANQIINYYPGVAELRKVERPFSGGKTKQRPLCPYEKMINHGKAMDMSALWSTLHPLFCKAVAYTEGGGQNHGPRGFDSIYLGLLPQHINVVQYGHYVLRNDGKVVKVRTVKTYHDEFPLLAKPQKSLSEAVPQDDSLDSAARTMSGFPVSTPVIRAPDKFPPGTKAMTTSGEVTVVRKYDDDDYCVRWETLGGPGELWTVGQKQLWLEAEYPDYNYQLDGTRTYPYEEKFSPSCLLEPIEVEQVTVVDPEIKVKEPENIASRTRSKAKCAASQEEKYLGEQYRVFDRGKIKIYSLKIRKNTSRNQPVLPEGMSLTPTTEELQKMSVYDVSHALPSLYHQTLLSPLREQCEMGQIKELQDLINRDVFGEPRRVSKEDVRIGLTWSHIVKGKDGLYDRVRARCCLMGNQEKRHLLISKLDAYAPVAQVATSRLLIAMHLHDKNVQFRKMDVSNAYVNENMRRKVLTKQPPGYQIYLDERGLLMVRKLKKGEKHDPNEGLPLQKALYGGMECGRIFWEGWVDWHLADGFQIIHEERCFLHKRSGDGWWIKLCFHVDDNTIAMLGNAFYAEYLQRLQKRFDVTEGPLGENLGMVYAFDREAGTCDITQSQQTLKMLKQFGYEQCNSNSALAPCPTGSPPCEKDCEEPYEEAWDMEGFVGHGSYLAMCTRPDISCPVKILSRYTKKFGKKHVMWAKHLLRYLKGTINKGLHYQAGFPPFYQVFTDASHASCVDTRRSITSLVIKYGGNTVFWKSSFTSIVSHSSTESELMALDKGATIGEALRWLAQAMGGAIQGKIQVYVDNRGTISIASNPVQAGRNMHVHARYFYVRDLVYDEQFEVLPLPSELQIADIVCSFKGANNFLTLLPHLMSCARVVHDEHGSPTWETMQA